MKINSYIFSNKIKIILEKGVKLFIDEFIRNLEEKIFEFIYFSWANLSLRVHSRSYIDCLVIKGTGHIKLAAIREAAAEARVSWISPRPAPTSMLVY
jgi:hypothetical protein